MSKLKQLKSLQKTADRCEVLVELLSGDEMQWSPIPNSPQELAYHSPAKEVLFGGQAGGGKSALVAGLALTGDHRKVTIIRREYPQLMDIISKIQEIYPNYGGGRVLRIQESDRLRTIMLKSCQHANDALKFKGIESDLYCFDEVSLFLRSQYETIIAWNRTPVPGQRCRVLATSNPPDNEDGEWIIDYWSPWLSDKHPNPAASGEIRYFVRYRSELIETPDETPVDLGDGIVRTPASKTFIRSSVTDNPYLMATGYDNTLDNLPEPLRSKLALGNFLAGLERDPYQVIPKDWLELAHERWRQRQHDQRSQMTAIAADPARGGGDRYALAWRYDDFVEIDSKPGKEVDNGEAGGKYILSRQEDEAVILVDIIGIGSSTYDYLRTLGSLDVRDMVASHKTGDRTRCGRFGFVNARAAWWWYLRESLNPQYEPTLCLPPDKDLTRELTAPRWKLVSRGIQLESKDEIKKRLGCSTDTADAVVMVCYDNTLSMGLLGT